MAYDLKNYGRGLACIFVNEKYDGTTDFSDRTGAHKEYKNLKRLFRDLTFKLQYHKDASNEKMKEKLQKACRNPELKERSCFVCVICSHGVEKTSEAVHTPGGIDEVSQHYVVDGKGNEINTKDIIAIFRDSVALRGKPKLFFIQACREDHKVNRKKKFDFGVDISGKLNQQQKRTNGVTTDGSITGESGVDTKGQEDTATVLLDDDVTDSDTDTDDGLSDKEEFDTTDYFNARRQKIKERREKEEAGRYRLEENDDDVVDDQTSGHTTETDAKRPSQRKIDTTAKQYPVREPVTTVVIPCYDDMLVMFASNPGKFALRDSHTGGLLVSSLCHVVNGYLIENGCLENTDFLSILTEVVQLQSRNSSRMEITQGSFKEVTTVPVIYHKLSKDLYIPNMKPLTSTFMHKLKAVMKKM